MLFKNGFTYLGIVVVFGTLSVGATAVAETSLTLSPNTPCVENGPDPCYDGEYINPIFNDAAPGYLAGSIAQDGGPSKTTAYVTPTAMFGRATVRLDEIASISYWTKKGYSISATPTDVADWPLVLYTAPYAGDISSATWYGDRIGAEPYFSVNLNDPANTWNKWSTGGSSNQLRFYESTQGYFGSYTDPTWNVFVTGNALSGLPLASREIFLIALSTGSAWTAGFTGQLDGLRIELVDGTVATVNFEPSPFLSCDPTAEWKNHGQFVRCVALEVNSLVRDGLMTRDQADGLVSQAAQSEIGK